MFLHLGNDCVVRKKDIIGIFDLENTSLGKDTKEFLNASSKKGEVIYITLDMPKSYIVCESEGKTKTYVSLLSAATLKKRLNSRMSTI